MKLGPKPAQVDLKESCNRSMVTQPTRLKWGQKWLEPGLIILAFFCLFVLLAKYVPSAPNSSDVELYFEIGLKGAKDTFVLNRYFHIYLQRIFILLAGNPLKGFQVFWAFLMATTSTLTFLLARKISNSKSVLIGLFGVAFFWSVQVHIELAGNPLVDFTAMTLATAIAVVYLYTVNETSTQNWLLILLGMLVFYGFKTKETTLPVSFIILILGWQEDRFNLRLWWKNIRFVLLGILVAVFSFFLLNTVFVKDPFFGFRPSEFFRFFSTYVQKPELTYEQDPYGSWYYSFWLRFGLLPFIFYILSGAAATYKSKFSFRIIWLTPLTIMIFIILSINNLYGFHPRFVLPALAIMCGLAPQILDPKVSKLSEPKLKSNFFHDFLSLGIAGILLFLILILGKTNNVSLANTYYLLLLPILFTLMLAICFWNKNQKLTRYSIMIVLTIALFFPLARNVEGIFFIKANYNHFLETVSPLLQFQGKVETTPEMLYCIETEVFADRPIAFEKNIDELYSLYDIVTNSNVTRNNFLFESIPDDLFRFEFGKPLCTYILIPFYMKSELENMPSLWQKVTSSYDATISSEGDLILYSRR